MEEVFVSSSVRTAQFNVESLVEMLAQTNFCDGSLDDCDCEQQFNESKTCPCADLMKVVRTEIVSYKLAEKECTNT